MEERVRWRPVTIWGARECRSICHGHRGERVETTRRLGGRCRVFWSRSRRPMD